jgi:hypothetical protein
MSKWTPSQAAFSSGDIQFGLPFTLDPPKFINLIRS